VVLLEFLSAEKFFSTLGAENKNQSPAIAGDWFTLFYFSF